MSINRNMDKQMWYIYTMENCSGLKRKEGNAAISQNFFETWGHYTELNMPVTKDKDKYIQFHIIKVLRVVKII